MNLESDKRLNIQLRLDFSSVPTGEARQAGREDIESLPVANEPERPANTSRIMEEVCERANLKEALRQVKGNKGSAGVDRITVDQLGDYLKQHWPAIREQLLNGTYEPKPVRRVESRSRMEEGCESLASLPCWTALSSKRGCRCCRGGGTRRFPDTAMGSDRVDPRITPWLKRSNISLQATAG